MSIRPQVQALVDLGPFPASDVAEELDLERRGDLLMSMRDCRLTRAEATALLACFGPDDAFGLAWTLLHLVETVEGPVLESRPPPTANEWVRRLWDRQERADEG